MKTTRKLLLAVAMVVGLTNIVIANELFLYNWPNYVPPALLERFEQETGISVMLDVYDSNESMLTELRAGATNHDIVVPSGQIARIMVSEGLAERINAFEMPNFTNVVELHKSLSFDPKREYSAPYMWGTTGIAYDTARTPELEDSWKEFFEPRNELKGHIVALNDSEDMYNAAAYYIGIHRCTESAEEAQRIFKVLEKQKSSLAMYSSSGIIDRMVAREVIMHHIWNGAAHRIRNIMPTVRYIYPKEGLSFWEDHFVVPKGAANIKNARIFINWMMDPRNAAEATNYTGYMNAIAGSEEYLDDSLKTDPAVNMPEEYADRLRPLLDCSKTARELRDKVWTQLKK